MTELYDDTFQQSCSGDETAERDSFRACFFFLVCIYVCIIVIIGYDTSGIFQPSFSSQPGLLFSPGWAFPPSSPVQALTPGRLRRRRRRRRAVHR